MNQSVYQSISYEASGFRILSGLPAGQRSSAPSVVKAFHAAQRKSHRERRVDEVGVVGEVAVDGDGKVAVVDVGVAPVVGVAPGSFDFGCWIGGWNPSLRREGLLS